MTLAIVKKSDNLIFMKELSATEVSRNFSEILDLVEAGEEVIITRGKKQIAKFSPIRAAAVWPEYQTMINLWKNHKHDPEGDHWDEVLAWINEDDSNEDS
jgi:antitoxin (DNA-binding transcriptional repressor) of toxin-antitoxin stability system